MGFICPECRIDFGSSDQLTEHYNNDHVGKPTTKPNQTMQLVEKGESEMHI